MSGFQCADVWICPDCGEDHGKCNHQACVRYLKTKLAQAQTQAQAQAQAQLQSVIAENINLRKAFPRMRETLDLFCKCRDNGVNHLKMCPACKFKQSFNEDKKKPMPPRRLKD